MKYVAIAASAATFWLVVATLRLIVATPPVRVVRVPVPAAPCEERLPAPGAWEGGPLSKSEVIRGMNGVKPLIAACYDEYRVPGLAMVNVDIGESGRVSSAAVVGRFAGTPTGTCVEQAVLTASFPPSDGLRIPYPFQLHRF